MEEIHLPVRLQKAMRLLEVLELAGVVRLEKLRVRLGLRVVWVLDQAVKLRACLWL